MRGGRGVDNETWKSRGGIFGGDDEGILGVLLISHPEILPQDFQVLLATPGLSHTLDIHTLPNMQGLKRAKGGQA